MDELWDVYDENRILTGDTVKRSSHPRNKDEYHLVVHIWIKNKSGEWLISKRAPNKFYPLLWECTGGSALAGESSLDAALREVKEELGIDLPRGSGCLFKSFKRTVYQDFCDVYVFDYDCSIDDLTFQENETCDAMWASSKEIHRMICVTQKVILTHQISIFVERNRVFSKYQPVRLNDEIRLFRPGTSFERFQEIS